MGGQVEAARSLGMTRIRVYGDVILPQALRIIVPPLGNIWIGLLKTATLMGVIAVPDLLYYAQSINMNYFAPFEAFSPLSSEEAAARVTPRSWCLRLRGRVVPRGTRTRSTGHVPDTTTPRPYA